jgi:hypothetical protein
VEKARLRDALALSPYEAGQWTRRGGLHLHRSLPAGDAAGERDRLLAHGITVFTCDEGDVRAAAEPEPVLGGRFDGAALHARTPAGPVAVAPADLLLVVKGPIAREHEVRENPRVARTATLEPGLRFHLHRHHAARPLEVDPAAFELGADRANESSLIEIAGWIAALASSAPVDDGFRRVTPALAPVIPSPGAPPALEDALRTRAGPAPAILDNLAQFRFYSAWRGAVERQARRG